MLEKPNDNDSEKSRREVEIDSAISRDDENTIFIGEYIKPHRDIIGRFKGVINPKSNNSQNKKKINAFLCHASDDKPAVRNLYKRLQRDNVDPWLDEENLIAGQEWEVEIPKAVKAADVVIVCLSEASISKEGYIQKEIRFALDKAEEKPEGTIFIIPLRLEECKVPNRLKKWQYVDLYSKRGYEKLMKAIAIRAEKLGRDLPEV